MPSTNEMHSLHTPAVSDAVDPCLDQALDRIAALTAALLQVPLAAICLADAGRIRFQADCGADEATMARCRELCAMAGADDVPCPPRHAPASAPEDRMRGVHFYASVPLRSGDGRHLGILCAFDFKPRVVPQAAHRQLQMLAQLAVDQLTLARVLQGERRAAGGERRFRVLFENIADPMLLLDPVSAIFVDWNPAARRLLRYPDGDAMGALRPTDISPPTQPDGRDSAEKAAEMIAIAQRDGSHRFDWAICSPYRDELVVEVLLTSLSIDGRQMFITTWRDLTLQKQAEQKLLDSEIRWKFAIEGSGDGLWDWNIREGTMFFSPRWKEMLGFGDDEIGSDVSEWLSRVHPDDRQRVMADIDAFLRGDTASYVNESRMRCKSGEYLWMLDRGKVVDIDADGRPLRMVGTHTDVTDRRRVLVELEQAESGHRALLEAMADGVFVTQDFRFVFSNPAMPQMLGYTLEEFVGLRFDEVVHPDFLDVWTERFRQRISGGVQPVRQYEVQFLCKGGRETIWIELIASRLIFQGRPAALGIVRNISEKKKTEELVWRQANYDALTHLPNRHMLLERLAQEIRLSHRNGQGLAVLFIDLDRFKEVNDTLGHHLGDLLLQQAAQRLLGCVREVDLVARLGGDEFTVVVSGLDSRDGAERVAHSILEALQQPFVLESELAYVTASIGITLYPQDAGCVEDMLMQADQAMYDAKHLGRNRMSYFTPSMQAHAEKRMRLVGDMHLALQQGQFCMVFQPIVDLATGLTHKAEALVRWNHPDKGLISPADFIPIAEETGLIMPLGDWVMRESLAFARHLRQRFGEIIQISINLSPVQFRNRTPQYPTVVELLAQEHESGNLVAVEITEGTLLEADDQLLEKLCRMRAAGIQLSLDDFGTGYSSLSYLNKFDIDYLKIDRSFVQGLAPYSRELALCEAMIVMAHKLDIKVIAEGVETAEQRDLLIKAGCDYAQGFLFARPLSPEVFEAFVGAPALAA